MNAKSLTARAVLIAGLSLASASVMAADLAPMPRMPTAPALRTTLVEDDSGFYVRGDVGIGLLTAKSFSQADLANNGGTFLQKSIGDTPYIGVGAGFKINNWFRTDLTAEYRATAPVRAYDNLSLTNNTNTLTLQANTNYSGNYSAAVALWNGYIDLGTWRGFTPYVGAGVGLAYNRMSGFTESAIGTWTTPTGVTTVPTSGILGSKNTVKFAWALMAGTSYDISPNAKLDIGYRYLNLGQGVSTTTGLVYCSCGSIGQPLKARDLYANEIRIGVRWMLDKQPEARPAPIIAKY